MILFYNPYTNPFFNLAAEEFLLNNFPEGFVMLWQNENTVVVGKHQNALAEINFKYVIDNHIKVARRISGGGTVFHDAGNLNFTIGLPIISETNIIDFRRFIDPVIEYLQSLGVNAVPSGRNDIIVNNLKISGNAEHHFRKEKLILHHGTLLFDSNLRNLGKAIQTSPDKYTDKAVQSVRSKVVNIRELLLRDMGLTEFRQGLEQHLIKHFNITDIRGFTCEETDLIEAITVTKFEKDEWNYGYSPAYSFHSNFEYHNKSGSILLEVERESRITKAEIMHPDSDLFTQLSSILVGKRHFPKVIDSIIKHVTKDISMGYADLTFNFF
ncbi:MAG: lipoate--protein ligase family protein [Bacteroidia bacterium]|nr:lipoate--protein ligase family protein [Bacteroidia bacterium]